MKLTRRVVVSAVALVAVLAATGAAEAQSLRDKWCSNVHIRFFAGGAEGDAFASIVYNGAVQAAKDTGAQVDYVFSGWKAETMVQQLREAIAAKPDGIAMMGHPGNDAIMPLAEQASKAGIKMMYQNVPLDAVVAKFGGGYVGAQQGAQGKALGEEAVRRFGLKKGDTAIVHRPLRPAARALCPRRRHGRRARGRRPQGHQASPARPSGPPIRTSRSR